jgi:hypothetical protein
MNSTAPILPSAAMTGEPAQLGAEVTYRRAAGL